MYTSIAPCAANGHHKPQGAATLPEAACSVNGFFTVNGYSRDFQATGRGTTPAEAATHLRETMDATRLALAPPPPPPPPTREEQLAALLACGLEKAVAKNDLALAERLMKAALLVLSDAVEPGNRAGMLAVRSQRDTNLYYEVDGRACTCPDYRRHVDAQPGFCCKHVCAVLMTARLAA